MLHRAPRKTRQDFGPATPRSTGARAAEGARTTVCRMSGKSRPGGAPDRCGLPWPGVRAGAVGEHGDALALADAGDPVVRAALGPWARPGGACTPTGTRA
ncbi:hypothetical protein GCM10015536_21330 [Streptomyces griseomycini]|nr:hypothetical protein GCM10015536_21330 [Streptomyces griseomycini]